MNFIPIIDLQKIREIPIKAEENKDWILAAQEIRKGLGDIGFMYLSNHGIDKSLVTKVFSEMKAFFDLPKEIKLKYKKGAFGGDFGAYFGYTQPGEELLHPDSLHELRETFDFMEGSGVYPDSELPDFHATITELRKQCNNLAKKILLLWAISLGLDDVQFFLSRSTHVDDLSLPRSGNIRALHYPPIPKDMEVPPGTVRLGAHSDYGMLTLLFQDMIGGLEVQSVDGAWVAATPIPDTILVNTGDLLQFWTSDIFPATKHRVLVPENEEQKRAPRYSLAYFIGPNVDTVVAPLKIKKTESEEKRLAAGNSRLDYEEMEPVIAMEYIMGRLVNSYSKP